MFRIYFLAFVVPFVTGQLCNDGMPCVFEWERRNFLDGYLNTTGPMYTSRGVVECGITCAEEPGCVSFFYVKQSRECKLQSVIVTTNTGLVPIVTAQYFARNAEQGPPGVCPPGWLALGNSCYHFKETAEDFPYAQNYCEGLDSHPIYVETTAENTFIKNYLNTVPTLQKWWIGLTDVETEGVYKWAGTNIVFNGLSDADWASGQPSGTFDCVIYNSNMNLQWYIGDCTRTDRSIICEKDII